MGGTKFMVIKFKEFLKTAIFAILGVIIIVALIYLFLPKNKDTALYNAGVYESQVTLNDELVNIQVTVDENQIKSVDVISSSETVPVFYPLFESTAKNIGDEIVRSQSLDIVIPNGAEVTGKVIIDAVEKTLEQAKK